MSFRSIHRLSCQRGGVIVTFALLVMVLVLMTALGMETFRLLTSRLQMQNIAEYVAEVALSDLVNSGDVQTAAAYQRILDENYFVGQDRSTGTMNLIVSKGCFKPNDGINPDIFYLDQSSCGVGTYQSVKINIEAINGSFAKVMARLFTLLPIEIRTSAFSYNYSTVGDTYFVTGPFRGVVQ